MMKAHADGQLKRFLALTATWAAVAGAPSVATAQTDGAVVEDEAIVVTARKREEQLVDVPLSVSVLSGATLEAQRIDNVEDLYGRTPSLFFSQNNTRSPQKDQTFLVLRGVGANPVLEPSVGVFVDGVYQPSLGFDIGFLDVDRIEVLRGPQATLFGRNTQGGALSIVTREPSNESRLRANVIVDDLSSMSGMVSLSGPLATDRVFAGLAVRGSGTDGYYDNVTLGVDQDQSNSWSGRFDLRVLAGPNTQMRLSIDGTQRDGRVVGAGIPDSAGEVYEVEDDTLRPFEEDQIGGALTIEHDFSNVSLTAITGYRSIEGLRGFDADATSGLGVNTQDIASDQSLISQEVRLASTGEGRWSWLVGAYAFRSEETLSVDSFLDLFGPPPGVINISSDVERTGYAIFGNIGFSPTDRLDLSAGLRWSTEEVEGSRVNDVNIPAFAFVTVVSDSASDTFDNVSPNFQLTYALTDDVNVYSNVARGYKAGGFDNIPATSSPYLPIEEETSWNYEVGLKGSVLGSALNYTLAAYYIDIADLQIPTLVIDPVTLLPALAIASAGAAHTQGVEFELNWEISDYLSLSGGGAYTQAEFDEFTDGDGTDRAGQEIPNVPEWTASLGLDYNRPIGAGMSFVAGGNVRYVSEHTSGIGSSGDPMFDYDSYEIVDARVGLDFEHWNVSLFANNVFDEYVVLNRYESGVTGAYRQVGAPRVIGVQFGADF